MTMEYARWRRSGAPLGGGRWACLRGNTMLFLQEGDVVRAVPLQRAKSCAFLRTVKAKVNQVSLRREAVPALPGEETTRSPTQFARCDVVARDWIYEGITPTPDGHRGSTGKRLIVGTVVVVDRDR